MQNPALSFLPSFSPSRFSPHRLPMPSKRLPKLFDKALRPQSSPPSSAAGAASATDLLPLLAQLSSLPSPSSALPTASLSPASPSHLARFLKTHPSSSPTSLLRRILHHPRLRPYDLHLLPLLPRHHSSSLLLARSLASSLRLDPLLLLLRSILLHPCPCSHPGIFSCPQLLPIFRLSLQALLRAARFDDALSIVQSLKRALDSKPPADLYNILINGFAKHNRYDDAVEIYHSMLRDRVAPDVFTFNILISSCCKSRSLDAALEWFKEIRARGCRPNAVTFNSLISGFFSERRFEEGIGVAREMLDLGYQFSVATCEILAKGLCREGRVEEACELLIGFWRKGAVPQEFNWLELVERSCAGGKAEFALKVFDELCERDSSGSMMSVVTCIALMDGLRNSGRVNDACRVMDRMLEKGFLPDTVTCNCLLEALCDAGRTKEANRLRVLAMRKGWEPDGVTFGVLVRGFAREGKAQEGEAVVNEMLDEGFVSNIASYNLLMKGLRSGSKLPSL